MYIHMYKCIYIYIYIYVCMYVCMYVCIYIYIYIYTSVPKGPPRGRTLRSLCWKVTSVLTRNGSKSIEYWASNTGRCAHVCMLHNLLPAYTVRGMQRAEGTSEEREHRGEQSHIRHITLPHTSSAKHGFGMNVGSGLASFSADRPFSRPTSYASYALRLDACSTACSQCRIAAPASCVNRLQHLSVVRWAGRTERLNIEYVYN